jgi:hypothetical protein
MNPYSSNSSDPQEPRDFDYEIVVGMVFFAGLFSGICLTILLRL